MPTGATGSTVTVELGFGSKPGATSPTWTDVSSYVDLSGSTVTISPGRTGDSAQLAPRTLKLTLDNRDGRFDPRDTSGPHYGNLVPRVPIRVRVNDGTTTRTVFRGFVDGGWPQVLAGRDRVVDLECLDAAGYAAQAQLPATAWEVAVGDVDEGLPDVWLQATPAPDSGYVDRISGLPVAIDAQAFEVDPLIRGEDKAYAPEYREGAARFADLTVSPFPTSTGTETALIGMWFRMARNAGDTGTVVLLEQRDASDRIVFAIELDPNLIRVKYASGRSIGRYYETDPILDRSPPELCNGRTVFLAVFATLDSDTNPVFGADYTQNTRVWFDGAWSLGDRWILGNYLPTYNVTTPTRFSIGCDTDGAKRALGPIDELVIWRNPTASLAAGLGKFVPPPQASTDAVAALHRAGRQARRGDTLAARFSYILGAIGWDHVGTVDTSGLVIPDHYVGDGTALDELRLLEASEAGRVWVDREGRFRYSRRSWAWADTVSTTVQVRFSDDPTDLAAGAIDYLPDGTTIVDDDRRLVNVSDVSRIGGRTQTATAAASVATYGRRASSTTGLRLQADTQARSLAEWNVYTDAEPRPRVDRLRFSASVNRSTTVPIASQIEPGWLVEVVHAGTTYSAHVVDVGHEIDVETWTVELVLDGSRAGRTWFTWGTSTWGGSAGWAF